MAVSRRDLKSLNELKMNNILARLTQEDYSIEEFEELVNDGIVTDDLGIAYLVINDEIKSEYNVFIERQCILKAGSIISFWGLLKMYGRENIRIKYVLTAQ